MARFLGAFSARLPPLFTDWAAKRRARRGRTVWSLPRVWGPRDGVVGERLAVWVLDVGCTVCWLPVCVAEVSGKTLFAG